MQQHLDAGEPEDEITLALGLVPTEVFDSLEIYGLTRFGGLGGTSIPNVVFATESDRARGYLTAGMVRFMDSGSGETYVLDCAEPDASGEVPVYEIDAGGVSNGRIRLAPSFGEFILEEVHQLCADEGIAPPGDADGRGMQRREIADYWKRRAADLDE